MAYGSYHYPGSRARPRISIGFDKDVFDAINKVAGELNLSFSSTVNGMIRKHLERHNRLEK